MGMGGTSVPKHARDAGPIGPAYATRSPGRDFVCVPYYGLFAPSIEWPQLPTGPEQEQRDYRYREQGIRPGG